VSKLIGKRRTAGMVAIMVACIAGASAYAFTASNTGLVDHKAGGSVAAAVSGYVVTNVGYTWDADGQSVNAVTFTLDAPANDVKAALTAATPTASTDYTDCGADVALTVTCPFAPSIANGAALLLTVVAVENGTATITP
jgi:hypothetical protein